MLSRKHSKLGRDLRCSIFFTEPVDRSSRTETRSPRSTKRSARCEPINPAPPVIRMFMKFPCRKILQARTAHWTVFDHYMSRQSTSYCKPGADGKVSCILQLQGGRPETQPDRIRFLPEHSPVSYCLNQYMDQKLLVS